ncbi:hypothetical protein ET445_04620 [Agromyces protaetiae]|uniref:Uncharacterized protein n=1 Tax=Agromyces protaetiae TaxID=2509455 RepID=A0A4P6F9A2_9MICO|nr:hypothetical protein [Agromyces protaetiae]QAY72730.1 hypothetical protein ET445_04620 [Agromyces protaetiae]
MRDRNRTPPRGRHGAPKTGAPVAPRPRRRAARGIRKSAAFLATAAVFGLVATLAIAPKPAPSEAQSAFQPAFAADAVQRVHVGADVQAPTVSQESYVAATGPETLIQGGTNHDWAKLVLVDGDFPVTDENVTVILRWMRQENGPPNWWNRNNPLNNGNGSGGGSGLGSYDTLQTGAFYAADSLRKYSFYDAIEAALERGDDANATAQAIWASPWAGSHYGNGTHWSTAPVPVVEAPADAWGR